MFAGCTQTVPKQRKTLKSQGFQGCLVRETGLELPDCSQNHKKSSVFNQFGKALMP